MKKIWVIMKREYITRVKNKTFIIMTFAGPLLIALLYSAIIFVATRDSSDKTPRKVVYTDASGFFKNRMDSLMNFRFQHETASEDQLQSKVAKEEYYAYLKINDRDLNKLDSIQWISKTTLSLLQQEKMSNWLEQMVYDENLKAKGLSKGTIDSLKPSSSIAMLEIEGDGTLKSSSSGIKSGIGFALAMLIYTFIFLYGSMVMRSSMEEKTNRIVEVIVSSVKPFHMMLGKILGVALVGFTQFAAWVLLSIAGIFAITGLLGEKLISGNAAATAQTATMPGGAASQVAQQMPQNNFLEALFNLPFGQIIAIFLIFFLGGFLLYSSMYAAIGAAVNQETDVQQFMLPISIPLIFGFVIAQSTVFQDPHGPIATIFSIIPFTSPVVMVVRSPFGVPWSELALSIGLLIATFVFMVWVSGRIYRVGILMYGKKPTWKELGKWLFSKD